LNFFRRYDLKIAEQEESKSSVRVGIFGSFRRMSDLGLLKDHLVARGYLRTFLSTDLEGIIPQNPGEPAREYNLRLGEALIKSADIHIVFFFKGETIEEIAINDSAGHELRFLADLERDPKLLILVQQGAQIGGMTDGLIARLARTCPQYTFSEVNETLDIAAHSLADFLD
jgi:hypothetical protein